MAVSVATSPQYPTRKAQLTFTCDSGGDYVRVFVTGAPLGSEYSKKLDDSGASRIQIHQGNAADAYTLTVDKGGKYTLAIQEITKGATAYGGGYASAPDGYQTETKIGESTVSVSFGTRLTMPVGTADDHCTLIVWVWDDTIRETTFAVHGEATPDLIDPSSPRARAAALNANVITALDALTPSVPLSSSAFLGTLGTVVSDLITNLNAHMAFVGPHASADTTNTINGAYAVADTPKALEEAVTELAKRLRLHMQTDSGSGPGSSGTLWHQSGGNIRADLRNLPFANVDTRRPGIINLIADIWRAYEAHRIYTAPHNGDDDFTNTAAALPPLLNLCRYFFAALATASPTAPATENGAVTYLVQNAGMIEG